MKKSIKVTRSSMPEFDEYIEEIKELWDSGWLTNMGVKHNKLETELAKYLMVENISLFTNGHIALESVIEAFQLTGEVITTPFTFISTTHAIVRNGLKPVFCDINPLDYTIDTNKIEELITDKTSAIIPVHVYGMPCNVEEIERIAKKHNLKVIYDAAHAFGVTIGEKGIGNFGDASMFSFHATKVFHSIEGGAVTFSEKELNNVLRRLKNFGITGEETADYIGSNGKMNEFQAAMGLCNLKHIKEQIAKRKCVVDRYIENLQQIPGIKLIGMKEGIQSNYAYFPVVFDGFKKTRDQIYHELKEEDIHTRKYFYPLTTDYECYRDEFSSSKTLVAQHISSRILTLPLYSDLELEEVDHICQLILR